jgi:hypothetical protein
VAISKALEINQHDTIVIKSDSRTSLDGIIKHLQEWEDKNWLQVENKEDWQLLAYRLRKRMAPTGFQWIKAHNGEVGNEKADEKAKGAEKEQKEMDAVKIPPEFEKHGARLTTMTQKIAYKIIIWENMTKVKASPLIKNAQEELERVTGRRPTKRTLWAALYKDPIKNNISDFLWKLLHGPLKCGKYYAHIPNWEDKQYCCCNEIETPEHILLYCNDCEVRKLWRHVELKWKQTTKQKTSGHW